MQDTNERPMRAAAALAAHLEWIAGDIERWLTLFADDAIVEFPYAPSLGMPAQLIGKPAIAGYFRRTPEVFRGFVFTDVRTYPTPDPDVVLAEFHGSATLAPSGAAYEQDYIVVLKCRDGKIVDYREYWDSARALAAFGGTQAVRGALGGE
jgi:uncharacterized protein